MPSWSRRVLFRIVVVAALGLAPTAGRAACGSANCFLFTNTSAGMARPGAFIVDLSWRYVPMDRKLEGSSSTDTVLTPRIDFENETIEPDHHEEISTLNSLVELALIWGATPRLTVTGVLPLMVRHDHEHFDDADTPDPVFSSTDGGAGFGDAQVGLRYGFLVTGRNLLDGTLAIKAPTGAWQLLDSEGAITEPGLQPGSGSWDLIASVHYEHQVRPDRLEWFVNGSWRDNRANSLDYTVGDESVVSVGIESAIGARAFWSMQVNARHAGRDDYLGDPVPSTGSTWVTLTPGLRSAGTVSVYGYVQVPVYQYVNESNLAPSYGVQLGVSAAF